MKRSVRLSRHLPKMGEMDARAELASHGQQVVIRPCSKRTNTKRQTICRCIAGAKNRPHIFSSGNNARQTKQRPWRIIGMYGEADTRPPALPATTSRKNAIRLLRKSAAGHSLIFCDQPANRFAIVRSLGSRESGNDRGFQITLAGL